MATDFSRIQDSARNFNEKYGLDFTYEAFERRVRSFQNISDNFANMGGDMNNQFYKTTFSETYRKALTNFADRKIDSFNTEQFIRDYVELMNKYKGVVNEKETEIKKWPAPSELLGKVQQDLRNPKKSIPDTKEEYIIQRYQSRELPIRKMREHVQAIVNSGKKDPAKFSTILAYANALEEINSRRPGWWRILNHFRNRAEQREAKAFKQIVRENFPPYQVLGVDRNGAKNYSKELSKDYATLRDISRDNSLLDAKNDIKSISDQLKVDPNALKLEESKQDVGKEQLSVIETVENVNQLQTSPAVTATSTELNKANEEIKQEEIKQSIM